MLDDVAPQRTTTWCLALGESSGAALDGEFDLASRDETESLAYMQRDGYLAFARNSHEYYSYW